MLLFLLLLLLIAAAAAADDDDAAEERSQDLILAMPALSTAGIRELMSTHLASGALPLVSSISNFLQRRL